MLIPGSNVPRFHDSTFNPNVCCAIFLTLLLLVALVAPKASRIKLTSVSITVYTNYVLPNIMSGCKPREHIDTKAQFELRGNKLINKKVHRHSYGSVSVLKSSFLPTISEKSTEDSGKPKNYEGESQVKARVVLKWPDEGPDWVQKLVWCVQNEDDVETAKKLSMKVGKCSMCWAAGEIFHHNNSNKLDSQNTVKIERCKIENQELGTTSQQTFGGKKAFRNLLKRKQRYYVN